MSARCNAPNNQSQIVRKSDLVKMLRKEHGLSKRKAAGAMNAVFHCMARALWRGENVELPVGSIKAVGVPAGRKQRVQKFRNIQTGEVFHRLTHQPERMIVFSPDPGSILRGPDALPPPPSIPPETERKVEELDRLFSQLMGREITLPDLQALMKAVVDPNKQEADANQRENLDRLLARLRQIVQDRRPFTDLPAAVRQLYWIR
jgi:nucleoid DNA-binding protein